MQLFRTSGRATLIRRDRRGDSDREERENIRRRIVKVFTFQTREKEGSEISDTNLQNGAQERLYPRTSPGQVTPT